MADETPANPSFAAAGYKLASFAASWTPGPVAQYMSGAAGSAYALAMREKRSVVERNLRRVNPALSGWALRRAVQASFDSYARYWVESFRLPGLSKDAVERGWEIEGFHHVTDGVKAGKGVILALPHMGGWEWAGRWMGDHGFRLTVVVERLENDELFEWFRDLRSELGMNVVPTGPDAAAAVSKALKNNEIVCLLCDRDLDRSGVEVEFFGERTTLPPGPAMLALRTGARLVPVGSYFTPRYSGHHTIVRPPVPAERHGGGLRQDVQRVTQALARELEFLIRRAPEQWHLFQPNWPSDPGYHD